MGAKGLRSSSSLLVASLVAAALLFPTSARPATFTLGFDGVPAEVGGSPGETVSFDAFVTITTADNETPYGPLAWTYIVGARGGSVVAIQTAGIKVSTIFDERTDDDPATPPIHHDPYEFDLKQSFTKINNHRCTAKLGEEDLGQVGFSLIGLGGPAFVALQPSGTQRIARITVQTTVPSEGASEEGCSPLELLFVEGGNVTCQGQCGGPRAVITHLFFPDRSVQSVHPNLDTGSARVCIARFRRGDVTADARVDISDAVSVLNFLFLGGGAPVCRDSADANNDSALDLTDPILILTRLFTGASTTVIPTPGIYDCGTDPEPDGLSCANSAGC